MFCFNLFRIYVAIAKNGGEKNFFYKTANKMKHCRHAARQLFEDSVNITAESKVNFISADLHSSERVNQIIKHYLIC